MAGKPRHKMTSADRAKQFMPFSALQGLEQALAAKERIVVLKKELPEEAAQELDRKMHLLQCGHTATVVYFQKGEYVQITGMVARIDPASRILQIVNTRIPFDDILDVIL